MAYLWLTLKSRNEILKKYGYIEDFVKSKKSSEYLKAIKAVNKEYLPEKFWKPAYFKETDMVLRNLRNLIDVEDFNLKEFKCNCNGKYCCGYPVVLDRQLLVNLQALRTKYGPTAVRGGMRCKGYNNVLVKRGWAIRTSAHTKGKALDIDMGKKSDTVAERRRVMADFKKMPRYKYTYCNEGNHPNMRNSIHIEVR